MFPLKNLLTTIVVLIVVCSCKKTVVDNSTPLATYSLGTGGSCAATTVSGRYVADTALDASNTIMITVEVSVAGPYWIITNTVNGMLFSRTGTFTSTGTQTIILNGSGTPKAINNSNFTLTRLSGPGGSCNFSVATVQGIQPHYFLSYFLNGVYRNFGDSAYAINSGVPGNSGLAGLDISGLDTIVNSKSKIEFGVGGTKSIGAGIYTNTHTSKGYFNYFDNVGGTWTADSLSNTSFTINLMTASAHYVQGTFSGTIKNQQGTGTDSLVVTNGLFTVPVR